MRSDWVGEILLERNLGALHAEGTEKTLASLRKAINFRLPDKGAILGLDGPDLCKAAKSTPIRSPYPNASLTFEWGNADYCAVVTEFDGGCLIRPFMRQSQRSQLGRSHWVLVPEAVEILYEESGISWDLQTMPFDEENPGHVSLICFGIFVEFCLALRCKNVYQEEIQPSKLAKMRAASKRKEVYSYHTLVIDPDGKEVRRGAGTHASPRVHLRRGHIRRLPSGDIWVNACVVGDKSAGMVSKDYAVAQSSSLH